MGIMAVAAVIVVLCLLFSWVYLDDGESSGTRQAEVGDFMSFEVTEVGPDGAFTTTRRIASSARTPTATRRSSSPTATAHPRHS